MLRIPPLKREARRHHVEGYEYAEKRMTRSSKGRKKRTARQLAPLVLVMAEPQ